MVKQRKYHSNDQVPFQVMWNSPFSIQAISFRNHHWSAESFATSGNSLLTSPDKREFWCLLSNFHWVDQFFLLSKELTCLNKHVFYMFCKKTNKQILPPKGNSVVLLHSSNSLARRKQSRMKLEKYLKPHYHISCLHP